MAMAVSTATSTTVLRGVCAMAKPVNEFGREAGFAELLRR
jgi:hypothetical protein